MGSGDEDCWLYSDDDLLCIHGDFGIRLCELCIWTYRCHNPILLPRPTKETHMKTPVKPITPKEIEVKSHIPDTVIEVVNAMIRDAYDGSRAVISQDVLASKICIAMNVEREVPFKKKWMDFEKLYKKAGWVVDYYSPDRGETGDSTFTFSKKTRR